MIRMITLILPLCCLFNPERHELARGIYIYIYIYKDKDKDKEALFNVAYNVTDNISS